MVGPRERRRSGLTMWSGIPPLVGLVLPLGYLGCSGWVLSAEHPSSAAFWWGLAGLMALLTLGSGARGWSRDRRVGGALAGRVEPDAELADQVDRVSWYLDDHYPYSLWTVPLGAFVVATPGIGLAWHQGERLLLVPVAGLVLCAVVSVVVIRRRQRLVQRWLAERPRPPDWRSVSPHRRPSSP